MLVRRKQQLRACLVAALVVLSFVLFGFMSSNPIFSSQTKKLSQEPQSALYSINSGSASYQESSSEYWYVGAVSTSPLSESNQGIRSSIQVTDQSVNEGVLSFWVSEAFNNNLWAQVGYYIQNGSSPVAFFQVWNLTERSELTTGTQSISIGVHTFAMQLIKQTNEWNFSIDGKSFGTYEMKANDSSSSYPIYAMSEEGYVFHPFSFDSVLFTSAIEVFKSGTWQPVSYAYSFGNAWGIQGNNQNPLLSDDELSIDGSSSALPVNSSLWFQ